MRYKAKIEEKGVEEEIIEERYVEELDQLERLLKDDRIKIDLISAVPKESAVRSPYGKIIIETLISETAPKDQDKKSPLKIPARFTLRDYALVHIYKKLRAVEPMVMELEHLISRARSHFDLYFKDLTRYDLSKVGRVKLNAKVHRIPKELKPADLERLSQLPPLALAEDVDGFKSGALLTKEMLSEIFKGRESVKVKDYTEDEARFLSALDLVNTIKYLINLRYGREKKDDIAYLGNRRIRAVGELLENQARIGIARMEKFFRDRCTVANPEDPNLKAQVFQYYLFIRILKRKGCGKHIFQTFLIPFLRPYMKL